MVKTCKLNHFRKKKNKKYIYKKLINQSIFAAMIGEAQKFSFGFRDLYGFGPKSLLHNKIRRIDKMIVKLFFD